MSVSKPVISIGTGLVLIAGIWQCFLDKEYSKILKDKYLWAFFALFLLSLLSFFYTEDKTAWFLDIRIKLPFLILPFVYNRLEMSKKQFFIVSLLFILAQFIVGALSLGRYFWYEQSLDTELITYIGKNGTMDIISRIHHIYFGLFLAFSVFLAAYWVAEKNVFFHKKEKWVFIAFIVLNITILHLLTSRTGLLVFYIGLFFAGFYVLYQRWKKRIAFALIACLLLIPILAYHYIPSFKMRYEMTKWDVEQYTKAHILCDCSLGKRFYVWEQSLKIIKENPFWGTGIGDLPTEILAKSKAQLPEMQVDKDMNESKLLSSPHNQYLEMLAGMGIIGLIILLYILIYPFIFEREQLHWLQMVLIVQLAAAMSAESLLKRQWGVAFFVVFLLISRRFAQMKDPN